MRAGVPILRRDVFLDNVAEVRADRPELRRLADKARRNGGAVGICHPYPETIRALQLELPKLAAQGVEIRAGVGTDCKDARSGNSDQRTVRFLPPVPGYGSCLVILARMALK